MNPKKILHVGPGHRNNGAKLPEAFRTDDWQEIRIDIDPACEPDVIGTILDLTEVADNSVDAVYSSHNIEHIYAHEVPIALKEFLRVLKPEGYLVITCPDLQTASQLVAEDKLNDVAYHSSGGPITPRDILFGQYAAVATGNPYMAHKTGFTLKTLTDSLEDAGFRGIAGKRDWKAIALWLVATKTAVDQATLLNLARRTLPA
jgi:protein O-GlcNAc transferase